MNGNQSGTVRESESLADETGLCTLAPSRTPKPDTPLLRFADKKIEALEERKPYRCENCGNQVETYQREGLYKGTPMHERCANHLRIQELEYAFALVEKRLDNLEKGRAA